MNDAKRSVLLQAKAFQQFCKKHKLAKEMWTHIVRGPLVWRLTPALNPISSSHCWNEDWKGKPFPFPFLLVTWLRQNLLSANVFCNLFPRTEACERLVVVLCPESWNCDTFRSFNKKSSMFWNKSKIQSVTLLMILKKNVLNVLEEREPCSVECRLGSDYLRHWFAHLSNNHHGFISLRRTFEKKRDVRSPHRWL